MKIQKRYFTLLEVMIALALFASLVFLTMVMVGNFTSSLQVQQERSAHIDQLVNLDKSIKKMFTNMVAFSWRDEDGKKIPHFLGTGSSIRFVHLNRVNDLRDGGLRFVELFVDDVGKLVALYQTRPFLNGVEVSQNAYRSVLAENIEEVSFKYASLEDDASTSDKMEWLEEWEDTRLDIPLAVMITVKFRDFGTETFLWRTAGNSFYERCGWRNGEKPLE